MVLKISAYLREKFDLKSLHLCIYCLDIVIAVHNVLQQNLEISVFKFCQSPMGLLHFSNLLRFGGQYCLKLARLRFLCPVMDWEPLSRRLCLLTCLCGALATLARLWLSAARPACFSASLHLSQHCSLCPVVSCCVPQLLLAPSLVRFPPLVTAAG